MTRREILQTSLAGLAALPVASQAAQAAEARKPNVIVIITDDQGSVDAGCYGSKDLLTPNLDALAARGVRFTQFYSAAPVCSAAAIMPASAGSRSMLPSQIFSRAVRW